MPNYLEALKRLRDRNEDSLVQETEKFIKLLQKYDIAGKSSNDYRNGLVQYHLEIIMEELKKFFTNKKEKTNETNSN